jgi:hypothetical protein
LLQRANSINQSVVRQVVMRIFGGAGFDHATEQAGHRVRRTLCQAFTAPLAAGIGHLVDQVQCQQQFDQLDHTREE